MAVEEHYSAFPKLMGAPAYARPPSVVAQAARPFDPDELPIMAEQTAEERALVDAVRGSSGGRGTILVETWMPPRAADGPSFRPVTSSATGATTVSTPAHRMDESSLAGHAFSLRDLTGRLRGRR